MQLVGDPAALSSRSLVRQEPSSMNAPDCLALIESLVSGGDDRLALAPMSGVNKYLCPPMPAPGLICLSSCTASPISESAYSRVGQIYDRLASVAATVRADAIAECMETLARDLGDVWATGRSAHLILCPSGTDAMLTAATLLAAERRDMPTTMVLPHASETGTGVPRALECRPFSANDSAQPRITESPVNSMQVDLRTEDGEPKSEDELNAAFTRAAMSVPHRAVIILTHSTKTGLVAPTEPRGADDVIVDACQGRIGSRTILTYLDRGWPVVLTGSKFFGGPPFSGVVLFPSARWRSRGLLPAALTRHAALPDGRGVQWSNIGLLLRWTAALEEMRAFVGISQTSRAQIQCYGEKIEHGILTNPRLVPVRGLQPKDGGWSDLPTIFTFAVRDLENARRRQSAPALRGTYTTLAREGFLLGQPVDLGSFGGLRIALGARDLCSHGLETTLWRLFDHLKRFGKV